MTDTSEPFGTDRLLFRTACDVTAGQRIYRWTGPWPPPEVLIVVTAPISRETAVTTPEELERVVSAGGIGQWSGSGCTTPPRSTLPAGRDDRWFRGAEYCTLSSYGTTSRPIRTWRVSWSRWSRRTLRSRTVTDPLGVPLVLHEQHETLEVIDGSQVDLADEPVTRLPEYLAWTRRRIRELEAAVPGGTLGSDRPPLRGPAMTWTPDLRGDEPDALSSVVHQALGAASVCWEDMSGFDDRPPPAMIWTPDLRGDEPDALSSVVHQALGAASVCWEDMSGTGVFDDRRARDIGASLVAWIRGHHAAITSSGHGDYRDSETGQFVPREYAEGHPATTEHER